MFDELKKAAIEEAATAIDFTFKPAALKTQAYGNGRVWIPELYWHQSGCRDCGMVLHSAIVDKEGVSTLKFFLGWDSFTGMRGRHIIQELSIDMDKDSDSQFRLTFDKEHGLLVLNRLSET